MGLQRRALHCPPPARALCTFTRPAVDGQPEAHGAAAVIRARCVLTLVAAQASGIALALVDVWNTGTRGTQLRAPATHGGAVSHLRHLLSFAAQTAGRGLVPNTGGHSVTASHQPSTQCPRGRATETQHRGHGRGAPWFGESKQAGRGLSPLLPNPGSPTTHCPVT